MLFSRRSWQVIDWNIRKSNPCDWKSWTKTRRTNTTYKNFKYGYVTSFLCTPSSTSCLLEFHPYNNLKQARTTNTLRKKKNPTPKNTVLPCQSQDFFERDTSPSWLRKWGSWNPNGGGSASNYSYCLMLYVAAVVVVVAVADNDVDVDVVVLVLLLVFDVANMFYYTGLFVVVTCLSEPSKIYDIIYIQIMILPFYLQPPLKWVYIKWHCW